MELRCHSGLTTCILPRVFDCTPFSFVTSDQSPSPHHRFPGTAIFEHADQLWLNGIVHVIKPGGRLVTCIAEMIQMNRRRNDDKNSHGQSCRHRVHSHHILQQLSHCRVVCIGFVALVASLAHLFCLSISPSLLFVIAHQASYSQSQFTHLFDYHRDRRHHNVDIYFRVSTPVFSLSFVLSFWSVHTHISFSFSMSVILCICIYYPSFST